MRRRRTVKKVSSESSDDEPLSKKASKPKIKKSKTKANDDSSSESDIENYLQPVDKIDLNSPFFNIQSNKPSTSDNTKNVNRRLSDSDFDSNNEETHNNIESMQETASASNFHFQQLQEYSKKMEEMKKCAEQYKTRKHAENKQLNITNLLAAGEAKQTKEDILAELDISLPSSDYETCSESEKEGWEEVKEKQKDEKEQNVIPKENLEITVEMPGVIKKKKGTEDVMASIKRRINRIKKENQIFLHKVHLLCWIAHGNYVSSTISSPDLLSLVLSLIPSDQFCSVKQNNVNYLEQILKWYRNFVTTIEKVIPSNQSLRDLLEAQIVKQEAYNKNMLVYLFVALLRSMGIQCRLVLSFQLEPLRPPNSELISLSTKNNKSKAGPSNRKAENANGGDKDQVTVEKDDKKVPSSSGGEISKDLAEENKKIGSKSASKVKTTDKKSKSKKENENSEVVVEKVKKSRSKSTNENNSVMSNVNKKIRSVSVADTVQPQLKKNKIESSEATLSKPVPKTIRTLRSRKINIPQVDGANDSSSDEEMVLQVDGAENNKRAKRQSKRLTRNILKKYKETEDSEDEFTTRSPFLNKNSPKINKINSGKGNNTESPLVNNVVNKKKNRNTTKKKNKALESEITPVQISSTDKEQKQSPNKRRSRHESDSDYVPEITKKRRESEDDFSPKTKNTGRIQTGKSGTKEGKVKKKQQGTDIWVEVFVESEKKWISIDVIKGQVNCVNELYTRATQPVSYIVAWNNKNQLKDVTGRYCQNFNTVTRKLRVDSKWWEETLKPFLVPKTPRDKEEDAELEKQHQEKPLPTSIAEYKNHPLYVLKRHLLKFEAIYPADAPTLGFVRNEPVYSRQCVYTLHSRDIWLKKAKVVKLGEKPYKVVKARPKYDKLSNTLITDQSLEIFGPWQTEDYVPPTAENGIVPRNAFGNVDLFLPSMLPKKTVHLKLAGLNKIAKRMNIDCASAIVGFDFHGGWSHPVYDGFVVCEEYADVLVAAWELEQDELDKKEQDKIDKRVYTNWKRLIKGLLIRERLKVKYEFGEVSEEKGKKKGKGVPKFSTKKK